jgi:hypothetical protein
MENTGSKFDDLPFELTQISKPARKFLKTLAADLIQYQKDLPVREVELFSLEEESDKF